MPDQEPIPRLPPEDPQYAVPPTLHPQLLGKPVVVNPQTGQAIVLYNGQWVDGKTMQPVIEDPIDILRAMKQSVIEEEESGLLPRPVHSDASCPQVVGPVDALSESPGQGHIAGVGTHEVGTQGTHIPPHNSANKVPKVTKPPYVVVDRDASPAEQHQQHQAGLGTPTNRWQDRPFSQDIAALEE